MPTNKYQAMAEIFGDTFDRKRVAIFPIDHGGAVQAQKLVPYLQGAGVNFVMYEREGSTKPQEHCIDQGNTHLFREVRQIVTPRRDVRRFLRSAGEVDDITVIDDWATSPGMPSLGGGYVYFVMLGYPNTKTAVFRDRCGGSDISPDRKSCIEYSGTRDYMRQHCPNTTYYLLRNGLLQLQAEDCIYSRHIEGSSWLESVEMQAMRYADQLLVTPFVKVLARPVARYMRRTDFMKESTDRMLKTAALL